MFLRRYPRHGTGVIREQPTSLTRLPALEALAACALNGSVVRAPTGLYSGGFASVASAALR